MKRWIRWVLPALLAFSSTASARSADPELFIHQPQAGEPVFGSVVVEVENLGDLPLREMIIRLDGQEVARLTTPPFQTTVDVGQDNREHTFEIVATDVDGRVVERVLRTGKIQVHDELDLGLQQLYVTVQGRSGRVLDLTQEDFQVLDNRADQELVTFEDGNAPFTAALLVDSSRSMRGAALRSVLAGVREFVVGMRDLDEARVLVVSDRLQAATPFTSDSEQIARRVDGVEASGGTSVYDYLYLALQQVGRRQGRQVVILLSDGIDVESVLSVDDVAWKAQRSQALIYWIRPSSHSTESSFFSFWRSSEDYRSELQELEDLVTGSGGRILPVEHIDEAASALQDILAELRQQYVLGYYPTRDADDGAWHEVKVKVDRPGVEIRSRGGYFDEGR